MVSAGVRGAYARARNSPQQSGLDLFEFVPAVVCAAIFAILILKRNELRHAVKWVYGPIAVTALLASVPLTCIIALVVLNG